MLSRLTVSPVHMAASERVVGILRAAMASLTMYSRITGPSAARPSPRRENRVGPDPLIEPMPGIGLRYGLRPRRDGISGKNCDAFLAAQIGRVDAKALRQRIVKPDEFRRCDFGRCDALVEGAGKARVAVVERNRGCGFRRWGRGIILQGCHGH